MRSPGRTSKSSSRPPVHPQSFCSGNPGKQFSHVRHLCLLFMVISLNFRKCMAIFTDFNFFTVVTAGLTQQLSSMLFASSIWPCFMSLSISFPTFVSGSVLVSYFLYQFCIFLQLYFHFESVHGVIFVEK